MENKLMPTKKAAKANWITKGNSGVLNLGKSSLCVFVKDNSLLAPRGTPLSYTAGMCFSRDNKVMDGREYLQGQRARLGALQLAKMQLEEALATVNQELGWEERA